MVVVVLLPFSWNCGSGYESLPLIPILVHKLQPKENEDQCFGKVQLAQHAVTLKRLRFLHTHAFVMFTARYLRELPC